MSNKRPADGDGNGGNQPPLKRIQFEPINIGSVSTLEEMDIKVLQYKNKKLAQRLEQRNRIEADLQARIEQLEKRQTQDDAVLNVVNRYWNQLNEDIRILLQRFDAETADESENKNEGEATTSFLHQLSTWDKEELDEKLANRVQVSKRAVAKVIQAFDRLQQRNEKITLAVKGELDGEDAPTIDEVIRQANIELQAENKNLHMTNTTLHKKYHAISLKMAEIQDRLTGKETEVVELRVQMGDIQYDLDKAIARNCKLENHLAEAYEKLKNLEQVTGDQPIKAAVAPNPVSQKKMEDLQKEIEEVKELANNRLQELEKLHQQHRETLKEVEKLKMEIRQLPESVIVETTEYKCLQSQFSVLYNESMQLKTQLEEARSQLQSSKNAHLRQIEMMEAEELMGQKKLRTEVIQLEDLLAQLRKEYEMLRIEFEQNLAANEQTGPINREMRHLITSLQNHNQQLKVEVHRYKRKYKEANSEIPKLKKEIEELEAKLTGLQGSVQEAGERVVENTKTEEEGNGDVGGAKVKEEVVVKKEKEGDEEQDTEETEASGEKNGSSPTVKKEAAATTDVKKEVKKEGSAGPNAANRPGQAGATAAPAPAATDPAAPPGTPAAPGAAATPAPVPRPAKESKPAESEHVRDLKAQIKKLVNEQKEMKLLLDMYKGVSKEQRDKVQLMASEKKLRAEVDELRVQLKKIQESKREERKKLADEDALRKIKHLEEQTHQLQKQVQSHKQGVCWQEEEALLNEMEVTGQAFEDMQEQNSRLIQQLREKDDANFKLMSERIKSNQLLKLCREEKDALKDQVITFQSQIDATNQVVRKLEEKERILQNSLATVEKELALRQQAMEMHKRKAIESAQSAADLKLHLEKYHAQMKEAQQVVAEKTSALEAEAFKTKRLQEEIAQLRRKTERMKKIEMAGTLDEVMREEIREYKETLTCPSCKVKRKDAVLSKCFHVFCYDCLKTRYETRQRKCPKCNAAFGANDYHRLYLSS